MSASEPSPHLDVASYALGVLDAADTLRFEDHLATCDACAEELAALLPVAAALARVRDHDASPSPDAPLPPPTWPLPNPPGSTPPGSTPPGSTPPEVGSTTTNAAPSTSPPPASAASSATGASARRRATTTPPTRGDAGAPGRRGDRQRLGRRGPSRRLVTGALTAIMAMIVIAVLGTWFVSRPPDAGSGGSDARSGQPTPTSQGDHYSTTDPTTGVRLEVALDDKTWGTQVYVTVANVTGPRSCRLLAVTRDGTTEEIATWRVPDSGYGVSAGSRPVPLMAATELARRDIQRIELRATAPGGTSSLLSSVDV